jgi:hypothetical protein
VLLRLPNGMNDVEIATQALQFGLAPMPLSPWHMSSGPSQSGLMLYVTNVSDQRLSAECVQNHNERPVVGARPLPRQLDTKWLYIGSTYSCISIELNKPGSV